ncbi:MAG: ParA family protein, partial [Chryseobacterium gambrini]|nr:ParA family protein [Chryseobacterium gambrini]
MSQRKINVFDFDFQKSFYNKWKEDEILEAKKLYDVEVIGENDDVPFEDLESIHALKDSEEINIF